MTKSNKAFGRALHLFPEKRCIRDCRTTSNGCLRRVARTGKIGEMTPFAGIFSFSGGADTGKFVKSSPFAGIFRQKESHGTPR